MSETAIDPTTAADDIIVDGQIITAENYDSALRLGGLLAGQLSGRAGHNVQIDGTTSF